MGFLKRSRKPKSRLLKEPKGYAWPKSSPDINRKLKNKHNKTKYTSAESSKKAKNKNVRIWMYTFSLSAKNSSFDDDSFSMSTVSASSGSSRDVEAESSHQHVSGDGLQELSLQQIQTRSSSESILSGSSVSSYTSLSDDSCILNHMEVRDDVTRVTIGTNGNRDDPDSEMSSHVRRAAPPLLPPPRCYVPDPNTGYSTVNDEQAQDTVHELCSVLPTQNVVIRNKSLPSREIRRNASEESRGFVHVFHQPLPPLDEEISLYDSGNDADDEFLDECSETSHVKSRRFTRRGSMSSTEDECDLRHRWEYGLAMTAKMGTNDMHHQYETLNREDSINVSNHVILFHLKVMANV